MNPYDFQWFRHSYGWSFSISDTNGLENWGFCSALAIPNSTLLDRGLWCCFWNLLIPRSHFLIAYISSSSISPSYFSSFSFFFLPEVPVAMSFMCWFLIHFYLLPQYWPILISMFGWENPKVFALLFSMESPHWVLKGFKPYIEQIFL